MNKREQWVWAIGFIASCVLLTGIAAELSTKYLKQECRCETCPCKTCQCKGAK